MNNKPNESRGGKRPYQTPDLVRIELRADEAVLGACKSSSTSTGRGGMCVVGSSHCNQVGS